MPDKAWVNLAQFLVNVILAVVTLLLFFQGQRDRRRVEDERRRDQAKRISLLRHEISQLTRPARDGWAESWSISKTNVTVRNDSELPITQVSVRGAERPQWNEHQDPFAPRRPFRRELVKFRELETQPFGLGILPGEALTYEGEPLHSHNLRLYFVDGAGIPWIKDTSDGKLWCIESPRPTLRSKITQGIVRTHWLGWLAWLIHHAPHKYADRRFRQTEAGIPWSARWIRFSWGFVPIGEPDVWDMPAGAPAREWPYDFWIDLQRRHSQRIRRGPCGLRPEFPNPPARNQRRGTTNPRILSAGEAR